MKKIINQKNRETELGQSLVEFTLMSIIVALILAGIIDLGRAFFAQIAITDAAGEGAIYAALNPTCFTSGGANCGDPDNVEYRVKHASNSRLVSWENVGVAVNAPVVSAGHDVTVTVSYSFTLITPFISSFVGDQNLVIRARARQMIQ